MLGRDFLIILKIALVDHIIDDVQGKSMVSHRDRCCSRCPLFLSQREDNLMMAQGFFPTNFDAHMLERLFLRLPSKHY